MTILIEIMKMDPIEFGRNKWRVRIGDIEGSTELSNVTKGEVIREVEDSMEEEEKK